MTHRNGTRDMWVGGWLTAMARMVCGRADSSEWHARNVELGVNECKYCQVPQFISTAVAD